jgi:hypothetical protein
MSVSVGQEGLRDLVMRVTPGGRMSGRLEFEGAGPPPTGEEIRRFRVSLSPVGGTLASHLPSAFVTERSTFQTRVHPAGEYELGAFADGSSRSWTVKSIVADGREVTWSPVRLTAAGLDDVVMTLTTAKTDLSGSISAPRRDGERVPVLIFPRGINDGDRRPVRLVASDSTGRFRLTDLPAGDYLLVALGSRVIGLGSMSPWFTPTEFEAFARSATPVTLRLGERATVDLPRVHGR